jgi:hypothetical protein
VRESVASAVAQVVARRFGRWGTDFWDWAQESEDVKVFETRFL